MDSNQIMALAEQYAQDGKDLAAFIAAYNLMAATGKTPLGLNQWRRSDKPRMEDFNEDNLIVDEAIRELQENKVNVTDIYSKEDIDEQMANKANKEPAEFFNLPLPDKFTGYITYGKNDCSEVSVCTRLEKADGSAFSLADTEIAVLPFGFRPNIPFYDASCMGMFTALGGLAQNVSVRQYVSANGSLNLGFGTLTADCKRFIGTIQYPTAP